MCCNFHQSNSEERWITTEVIALRGVTRSDYACCCAHTWATMDESGGGAFRAHLFWQHTVDMSCFFLVPVSTTRHTPPVMPLQLHTLTPRTTNALPHVRRTRKLGDVSHAEAVQNPSKKNEGQEFDSRDTFGDRKSTDSGIGCTSSPRSLIQTQGGSLIHKLESKVSRR